MSAISRVGSRLGASIKAYKWIWAGGGVVVVAGVAALLIFGGLFGPSGHAICKVAVQRARDYGTIPTNATQDGSAKRTDVADRKSCEASADGEKYTVTVDLKCKDLKNHDCLPIYSVERSDGLSLYQVRAVPDDADTPMPAAETGVAGAGGDAAPAAAAPAGAAPPSSGGSANSGGDAAIDTDVVVAQPASGGGQ